MSKWCTPGKVSVEFDPAGEGDPVLLATLRIGGTRMHLMAIEVRDGSLEAVDVQQQRYIDGIAIADDGEDYELYSHNNRWYFLVAHPYQR